MSEEKLVTTIKGCVDCEHREVCRHRKDYLAFLDAISEFSKRYSGDKICDGVVAVDVSCNYYTPDRINAKHKTESEVR